MIENLKFHNKPLPKKCILLWCILLFVISSHIAHSQHYKPNLYDRSLELYFKQLTQDKAISYTNDSILYVLDDNLGEHSLLKFKGHLIKYFSFDSIAVDKEFSYLQLVPAVIYQESVEIKINNYYAKNINGIWNLNLDETASFIYIYNCRYKK